MTDGIENLLRELVDLSRQQLANQEAAMSRQAELMAAIKRRTVLTFVLLMAAFVLIGYVVYLSQALKSGRA